MKANGSAVGQIWKRLTNVNWGFKISQLRTMREFQYDPYLQLNFFLNWYKISQYKHAFAHLVCNSLPSK